MESAPFLYKAPQFMSVTLTRRLVGMNPDLLAEDLGLGKGFVTYSVCALGNSFDYPHVIFLIH